MCESARDRRRGRFGNHAVVDVDVVDSTHTYGMSCTVRLAGPSLNSNISHVIIRNYYNLLCRIRRLLCAKIANTSAPERRRRLRVDVSEMERGGYQLQQLPNNNRAPAISGSRLHQAVSRARWSGRIPWWVIESSGARQSSSLCPIISGDSGNFRKQNSDSDNGTDLNKSYKSSFIIQKKTENIILFLQKKRKIRFIY